ncbi:MAG TPA: alpha-L-fucosidase, partial [Spirochaetota bacterium]|nr:alpha-L-fucosidase [Spirochaetota bacterium]
MPKTDKIYKEKMKHTAWFRSARYGMFIHFGLYSIPARGEWVQSQEKLTAAQYAQFFKEFKPAYNCSAHWTETAAAAGMKYAVLTAKHHDGFCLFDSKHTDYKITNTPYKKDLVKEYLDNCRKNNIKTGPYYSLVDWHHPHYPAWQDRQHPMRDNPEYQHKKIDFDKYLEYMHSQVKELCENYGKIDLLWFDFSYHDMRGEKWKAAELVKKIRKLQPEIIINNRLGGYMLTDNPDIYAGDFCGPEQIIPRQAVTDYQGRPVAWETCLTLNDHWGYAAADHNYKSDRFLIQALINCVSKNGNLLLNVGPAPDGQIPAPACD